MTLRELSDKDIIDIKTGINYGKADDIEFLEQSAVVQKLILHGRPKLFGLLGKEDDVSIDWGKIAVIGADAVLVDLPIQLGHEQKVIRLNNTAEKEHTL